MDTFYTNLQDPVVAGVFGFTLGVAVFMLADILVSLYHKYIYTKD